MRAPGQASGLRLGKGAEPAICDPERSPAWAAFDCYFGPTPFTSQGCTSFWIVIAIYLSHMMSKSLAFNATAVLEMGDLHSLAIARAVSVPKQIVLVTIVEEYPRR